MADTGRPESSALESQADRLRVDVDAPSRLSLIETALRLSYFTIGWNGLIGASGLVVALFTGSLALAGFALGALLDSSASLFSSGGSRMSGRIRAPGSRSSDGLKQRSWWP